MFRTVSIRERAPRTFLYPNSQVTSKWLKETDQMRGNPRNLDSNKEKDTFLNSGLLVSNFAFFLLCEM